jgi:DNA-binding MarR family transcriptional regulator
VTCDLSRIPKGISVQTLLVLDAVDSRGATRLTDLAGMAGVTTAAMTSLADRLTKRGLACRISSDLDRREKFLEITGAGQRLLRAIKD